MSEPCIHPSVRPSVHAFGICLLGLLYARFYSIARRAVNKSGLSALLGFKF